MNLFYGNDIVSRKCGPLQFLKEMEIFKLGQCQSQGIHQIGGKKKGCKREREKHVKENERKNK